VTEADLRAQPVAEIDRRAALMDRRIVTENVKDFRPLLQHAYANEEPVAAPLLVPSGRFPGSAGRRAVISALLSWLDLADRPDEAWLV
jgi:hypothetical protein